MNDDLIINGGDPLDFGGGGPPEPIVPPADDKPADPNAELREMLKQQGEQIKTLAETVGKAREPAAIPPTQPTVTTGGANTILLELQGGMQSGAIKTPADLEAFWERKFIESPGKAMVAQQDLNRLQAAEAARAGSAPYQEASAIGMLDQFRRDRSSDPMFLNPDVRKEFDALVEKERASGSFGKFTPQQIEEGLGYLFDTAIGRVARKRATGTDADARSGRGNRPPLYPVGGGGGFGNMGGGGTAVDVRPRNEVETQFVESARDAKFSAEEIAEGLRQMREESA